MSGIFPGQGRTTWRDWYTHDAVNATVGENTTLNAPLGHINVHIRDGAAILLHSRPGYTTTETRTSPYTLLVSQAADGSAFGSAYFDDGESIPPTPHRDVMFHATNGSLKISGSGTFSVQQKLESVTVLGTEKPTGVSMNGKTVESWEYLEAQQKVVISGLTVDLNVASTIVWH